jgi:hypothetical protein
MYLKSHDPSCAAERSDGYDSFGSQFRTRSRMWRESIIGTHVLAQLTRQMANWGLPIAALTDVFTKDEEYISGVMSPTLGLYS